MKTPRARRNIFALFLIPALMFGFGYLMVTVYRARNTRAAALVSQAVPSVSPSRASTYFNKTECFCFTQQEFTAHESRDLPVRFVIHPDLPDDIDTVTLAYTFFEVAGGDEEKNDEHGRMREHDSHSMSDG